MSGAGRRIKQNGCVKPRAPGRLLASPTPVDLSRHGLKRGRARPDSTWESDAPGPSGVGWVARDSAHAVGTAPVAKPSVMRGLLPLPRP